MPGNSLFLNSGRAFGRASSNRWLAPLWLLSCSFLLPAQIHKVDPEKTITFPVPGATAAYGMEAFVAEATAENGVVSVVGIHPGTTQVVVVTPSGVQTFQVLVTTPPPKYPPGFVAPVNAAEGTESGYYEGRYYSSPAQIQDQFDFSKANGDDRTHVHVVETSLLGPLDQGQSRIALSSASYQIVTPERSMTFFDQYVNESQLTIDGSIIRGFHMEDGNWFVHAGYTSVATFEGLFLPIQPELVVGGGYRYPLTADSSITGSFYQIRIPSSDMLGRSGSIGALRYKYAPRENFWFTADLGISHGIAGSTQLFYKTERDNVTSLVRYMPLQFASLGANNLRGLHTDASWTRHLTDKFESTLTFYNNNLVLPDLKETTISGAVNLLYQLTRHWGVTGGALASSFQTTAPPSPAIRNFTLPAGLAFQSLHFGATGQYQFAVTPGREDGAKQFRTSLRSGWGAFTLTGYAERDTNAPTLSFIFSQVTGLQQILQQQGIQATTVQQVDELLSSDAYLIAAGYIKGATINVVPVRIQVGGTADWSSRGKHKRALSYSFLYNDNQALDGSTQDLAHTLTYSQSITNSDKVALSCSVVELKNPGIAPAYTPLCYVAWRHQFQHVPYLIIPERRGTISGNVFRDDQSVGELQPGMLPMPEVEISLDDRRHTMTRADGSFRFPSVPRGNHKVAAIFTSRDAFFFTTPSDAEVDEDATVNFGIGYTLSGLMAQVLNDAGQGVAGVTVAIQSRGQKWSAVTDSEGSIFVSSLVAGEYDVQADEDSLPSGYSADSLGESQKVTVGATAPGKAAFSARALRSISGRVLTYNPSAGRYVPVIRGQVLLRERELTTLTDEFGRYLFRDLAAGSYTVSFQNESTPSTRAVRLGAEPVDLANVDFQISKPIPSDAPASPAKPVSPAPPVPAKPQPLAPPAPVAQPVQLQRFTTLATVAPAVQPPAKSQPVVAQISDSGLAAAQQHNLLGRQLSKAGRYREAIVELTEALRIAPDFALALNARGFALFMLHDWKRAIADLDQAILLNPNYGNAYHIRGTAKKAIGDTVGAAADLERAQQLAH